jgi:hypothetical protein
MSTKYLRSCLNIKNCGVFFEVPLDSNADPQKATIHCPFCRSTYPLNSPIPKDLPAFSRPTSAWRIIVRHDYAGTFEFNNGKWTQNGDDTVRIYDPAIPPPWQDQGYNLRYIVPEQIRALVVFLSPELCASGRMRIISID